MTDVPFPGGARGAPAYGISSGPRRSSYASVVSGAAFSPPISSPFSHLLNATSQVSSYPPPSQPDGRHHRALSGLDVADMHLNSAWRTSSSSSSDSLPSYSRKYVNSFRSTDLSHRLGLSDSPPFFIPTYLRHSRYISRLDAAYQAKLAAQQRDGSSANLTSNLPLSTSSSHAHLPRMAPSHRGMTHDIIEREPPTTTDPLMPLPTQWSASDKYNGLEISPDGLDVRYSGPAHKHDHEAAALRADNPMPPQCGMYYYEIRIESKPKEGMIGIGFSSPKASVERLPGWEQESWAYHGDDGDIVGCGVNFTTGAAFFTKNGNYLGVAFHDLRNVKLYPSVGMKKHPLVHFKANFGQEPFVFDIDGMVREERAIIQSEIDSTSTATLKPSLEEPILLQELVAQFLAHDGYVETARAFAEEVATETTALSDGQGEPLKKYVVEEDREAINRNQIRAAILDGDIDKALKLTKAYYGNVLQDHPQIHFKLRCRKFLELIRYANEFAPPTTSSTRQGPASPGASDEHAVFDQEMELDDSESWDAEVMDTEDPEAVAHFNELLTQALQYGQQLCTDHQYEENAADRTMLKDIFSLFAYSDPHRSMHGHCLDPSGRVAVAEELNSAILVSLGKSSAAALERLYQQTEALVNELSEDGGAGAFINIRNDILL